MATGNDFLRLADGNEDLAFRVFQLCEQEAPDALLGLARNSMAEVAGSPGIPFWDDPQKHPLRF